MRQLDPSYFFSLITRIAYWRPQWSYVNRRWSGIRKKKRGKNAGNLNWIMNNVVNCDWIAYGRRAHRCANEFYSFVHFFIYLSLFLQLSPSPLSLSTSPSLSLSTSPSSSSFLSPFVSHLKKIIEKGQNFLIILLYFVETEVH